MRPESGPQPRWATPVGVLFAAALAVTLIAGSAVAASAAVAAGGGGPIRVSGLRPGTVVVAGTAARARSVRLRARLSITRPVGSFGVTLNGRPIRHPAMRSGRLRLLLDAAHGLVVGSNLLWISAGPRGRPPRWDLAVRFTVGYRDTRTLAAHLRLGAGRLPAATVRLRMPGAGVQRLGLMLNGRAVRAPGATGVLNLAHSGALHSGANRLRVRLIMLDGRIREWSRTFRLDRRRNVAVARAQGRAVVGRTTVLDASRSLVLPGVRRARGVRWVLLRRPRISHARLGRTDGVRVALRPDVPGHYVIALVVGSGARRGYDLLDVSVGYPEPLVTLNTITSAPDHHYAVQVGNQFYEDVYVTDPDGGPSQPAPVQVVVLARDSLAEQANFAYNATSQAFDDLGNYLKGLPDSDLVIITHPQNTDPLPSDSLSHLDNALHQIGGSVAARWTFPQPQPAVGDCWSGETDACYTTAEGVAASWQRGAFDGGSFTVIGVPGLAAGQAWRETATQTGAREGAIAGYLTQGTDTISHALGDYTVVNGGPGQYATVDTCSGSGCDLEVGDQSYGPPAANGLQVLVLDRTTLKPIINRIVNTSPDLLSALTESGSSGAVGHYVPTSSMNDQRLIILRSVGDGFVNMQGANSRLLQIIDELGGTPDLLLSAMAGGPAHRYALVGAATNLPWRNPSALESSADVPVTPGSPQRQTGEVSGALLRDRDGLYAPLGGDPIATTNDDLYRILYQPAQPWPYAADTADLKYIADNIGLAATPDVRSAYYNPALAESWPDEKSQLQRLPCPSAEDCGPGSSFESVRKQLETEFPWVTKVYQLGKLLGDPYLSDNGAAYFDVQQVLEQVMKGVPVPTSSSVTMSWLKIATQVMAIASGIAKVGAQPLASSVFGIISSAGALSTAVLQQPDANGGPADTLTTTAQALENQLVNQQKSYTNWLAQMEKILLYDYGKLSTIGSAVGDLPEWTWSTDTTPDAVDALNAGTVASAYSALLPVAWPVYNLKPDYYTQFSSNDVTTLQCNPGGGTVFAAALPENQFHAATTFASNSSQVSEVWLLTKLDLGVWNSSYPGKRTAQYPSASQTDYIYGRYATGRQLSDGTIQYGAYQYAPVWWRNTFNPPGNVYCTQVPDLPGYTADSAALPPPRITPPLP